MDLPVATDQNDDNDKQEAVQNLYKGSDDNYNPLIEIDQIQPDVETPQTLI